jgi:hypothetical protein
MKFRAPTSRWALWVFAAALMLRAAMPMLASASAEMQGKALVEVCTVYGMAMVPVDNHDAVPAAPHSMPDHGEHCALTALTALAAPQPLAPLIVAGLAIDAGPPTAHPTSDAPDATERWAARLKHGPPAVA